MCCRYYVDADTQSDLQRLTHTQRKLRFGDVRPSESAAILCGGGGALTVRDMTWGFPGYQGKNLLINARAETLTGKRAFRDSALSRRCVVPARGFYEWNREKERYQFEEPGLSLYLAGCYDDRDHFVIITTKANESVLPVHERMPLLIAEKEVERWIWDRQSLGDFLQRIPRPLHRWTPYRQMTLFDLDPSGYDS